MPSTSRPFESFCSEAACLASIAAFARSGAKRTEVTRRMRSVAPAAPASAISGS